MYITVRLSVGGLVQGVGFRPFIYHLATKHNITGWVKNTKAGVSIEATGVFHDVEEFILELKSSPPPLAIIKEISKEVIRSSTGLLEYTDGFKIVTSEDDQDVSVFLSPDVTLCDDCKKDFEDINSRFYQYPFVNCTNCGPRYSIITGYPYDRKNTTMADFEMCFECKNDYLNIASRRYHAEPVSCFKCGPKYRLYDCKLQEINIDNVFETVNHLLKIGKIIAVKGVGGYHLVCDAMNEDALRTLRKRKIRDTKPFAMLFRNKDVLSRYCEFSKEELATLSSKESPILLLKRRKGSINDKISDLIAGFSPYFGAMLPYAPYQHLLFKDFEMLIFTSGNLSGEPIVYDDDDLERLKGIADYFLIHNRKIMRFVEDSVVKIIEFDEKPLRLLIRKSKGYAPAPLFLKRKSEKVVLGFGGDLKASISFIKDDVLIQSQYLGDLSDYLSFQDYKRCFEDFKHFFNLKPELYFCDLHPSYLSTGFADEIKEKGANVIKVQHHKAHIASVALESGWFDEEIIGVALDGTGYGEDGAIWGGEVFIGSLQKGFERKAHISYIPFPFGDAAVKEPEKSLFSYFSYLNLVDEELYSMFSESLKQNFNNMNEYLKKTQVFTSSTGRLFDAVSFLLGFNRKIGYEGEAAIELENLIYRKFSLKEDIGKYSYDIVYENGDYVIDLKLMLSLLLSDWKRKSDRSLISIRFHQTIVSAFFEIIKKLSDEYTIKRVALSGGVFQNSYILYHLAKKLENERFIWAINRYSPPNDACVSIGQCALSFCDSYSKKI